MIKARIPEGTAILNAPEYTTDEYSQYMYKMRKKEYLKFISDMLSEIDLPQNAQVLEIGPGPAWITIFLQKTRPDLNIHCIELSPDMIRTAKKNIKSEKIPSEILFVENSVENMESLDSTKYDFVYSHDSLHHWENLSQAFSEINRVLKPNGSLYIHDSKRNLNIGGKLILYGLGKFLAGKMWKYWKSSVEASYTQSELEKIILNLNLKWVIKEELMDIIIFK